MWALLSSRMASVVVACGVVLSLVFSAAAFAATIAVTTTADELDLIPNTKCSLREAIVTVNEQRSFGVGGCSVSGTIGSNDVIVVPAGLYPLTRISGNLFTTIDQDADNLDILDDVTIRGAGVGATIIDGEAIYVPAAGGVQWPLYEGGVVRVDGAVTATIEGVTLRQGSALDGGAVFVAGTLTLQDSAVEQNFSDGFGGGIHNEGDLTLRRVTVSDNSADQEANLPPGYGGGIYTRGSLDAQNVTISGNSALGGGGLYIAESAGLTILDSLTITDNQAAGDVALTWSPAGGIDNWAPGSMVRIQNSIIAGNSGAPGAGPDCYGDFDSRGYNLIGDVTACTGFSGGDLRGSDEAPLDPLLAPLANYGGASKTHALLTGSPAVDGGPLPITDDCPDSDQRGFPRGIDGDGNGFVHCDIGAYEAPEGISADANLEVTMTAEPDPVAASGTLKYTVTVRNNGPGGATGVEYQLQVPAGAGSVSLMPAGCNVSGSTVTCDLGDMTAGEQTSGSIEVAAPTAIGVIIAEVMVTSTSTDPEPSDDTAEDSTLVVGANSADLALAMTAPAGVPQGGTIEYLLTVSNAGPQAADATARVTNFLPQSVTFVSATSGCTRANNIVTCPLPGLAAGASKELRITVTAPTQLGFVTNTASVSGAGGSDGDISNNSASYSTRINPPPPPSADLFIEKLGPSVAQVGDELSYTLIVNNNGPDQAEDVQIVDSLPAGVTVVELPAECSASGQSVTCDIGALEPFLTKQYTLVLTAPAQAGTIVNSAHVADQGNAIDDNPINDESNATTVISNDPPPPGADLALSKNGPLLVQPQATFNYVLVVTNNGPDVAANVTISDTLPAGLSVAGVAAGCAQSGATITCEVASLAAGANAAFTLEVIAPGDEAELINTATAASDTDDPVPGNDSDSLTTEVSADAPVGAASLTLKPHPDTPERLVAEVGGDGVMALRFTAAAGAGEGVDLESLTVRAAGSKKATGIALVELFLDADDDGSPDAGEPLASAAFAGGSDVLVLPLAASDATAVAANSSQNYLLLVDLGAATASNSGVPLALLAGLTLLPLGLTGRPRRTRLLFVAMLIASGSLVACQTGQPPVNGATHQLVIDSATASGAVSGAAAEVVGTPLAGVTISLGE